MNMKDYKELEMLLEEIYRKELIKIKASVSKYTASDSSRGIAQMIGRRYGYLWEVLVKETLKISKEIKLGDKIFYKKYVDKWLDYNLDTNMSICCIENSRKTVIKFLAENTGTKRQDLCDFTIIDGLNKYAIDTKFSFTSNDASKIRQIADSGKQLKFLEYEPILLFRTNEGRNRKSAMKRFKKNGWNIIYGINAIQLIKDKTGFDLGKWIDDNIDIWSELNEYQSKLVMLKFGEENWKF